MTPDLARFAPVLFIGADDPVHPVSPGRYLSARAALFVDGQQRAAAGSYVFGAPDNRRLFSRADAFVSAELVRPGLHPDPIRTGQLLRTLDELGTDFSTYVAWHETADQALAGFDDEARADEVAALRAALKPYAMATFYLFFPVQNGRPFGSHVTSWEGWWTAFSVLFETSDDQLHPLWVGLHGVTGTRVHAWNDLDQRGDHPVTYVATGTHSLLASREPRVTGLRTITQGLGAGAVGDAASRGGRFIIGEVVPALFMLALVCLVIGLAFGWPEALLAAVVLGGVALALVLIVLIVALLFYLFRDDDDEEGDEDGDGNADGSGSSDTQTAQLVEVPQDGHPFESDTSSDAEPAMPDVPAVDIEERVSATGRYLSPAQVVGLDTRWWAEAQGAWGDRVAGSVRATSGFARPNLERSFALELARVLS